MKMLNQIVLSRMSIDQLVSLLDNLFDEIGEHHEYYITVENVLNKKQDREILTERDSKLAKLEEERQKDILRSKVRELLANNPIKKMDAIFSIYFHEYENDYVIDESNLCIKSLVCYENHPTDGYWSFETITALNLKIKSLVYDRVYDRFIRRGSIYDIQSFYDEIYLKLVS